MVHFPLLFLVCFWGLVALRKLMLSKTPRSHAAETDDIVQLLNVSMVLAVSIVFSLFLPHIFASFNESLPHHIHDGDVSHPAFFHQFFPFFGSWASIVWIGFSAMLGGWLLWRWIPIFYACWRIYRLIENLRTMAVLEGRDKRVPEIGTMPYNSIFASFEGEVLFVPGAWCGLVGVFQPVLLFGTDLLASLSETELSVLVAHEEEHRRRKDSLHRFFMLLSSRILPWYGSRLFERWVDLSEQLCDLEAAKQVGDALTVATTMIRTQRIQRQSRVQNSFLSCENLLMIGFTQSPIESRIRALLRLQQTNLSFSTAPCSRSYFSIRCFVLLLLLHCPLHHTVEFFISLF